jgi:vacuolar-type H+-ATPase subunit E/Vma4
VGLDQLIATLTAAAETEAAARRQAARAEADRLREEADRRVAAGRATTLGERERVLQTENNRLIARERQAQRITLLERREAMLVRIRELASGRLPEVAGRPEYQAMAGRSLEQALEYFGDGPGLLRTALPLKPVMEGALAGRAGFTVSTADAPATGAILARPDGSLTVDLTLEAALAARWEELRQVLSRWLEEPA